MSYSPLFTLGLLGPVSSRSPRDDASAIYFTLKTAKRDSAELRSFLYLDLADNKRHAPSHRRKFSILSKSTSWTCTADVKSVHDSARSGKSMITSPSPSPVVPARRRTSKESLRNIPSPKPAPSTTLPDLPTAPPSPAPSTSASPKRRPASSLPSPSFRARRPASSRSESVNSVVRRRSRMDALACLEGRSRAPNRVPRASSLRNNFMSFSDDEDERSTRATAEDQDLGGFADVEDEADAVDPTVVRRREGAAVATAAAAAAEQARPARSARPARKRRGTIESWFPLKSFIDLKDDDLSSWNWRSFIEIGGVA